jgi:hypothetical protein
MHCFLSSITWDPGSGSFVVAGLLVLVIVFRSASIFGVGLRQSFGKAFKPCWLIGICSPCSCGIICCFGLCSMPPICCFGLCSMAYYSVPCLIILSRLLWNFGPTSEKLSSSTLLVDWHMFPLFLRNHWLFWLLFHASHLVLWPLFHASHCSGFGRASAELW